jgi:hypothetical protein
MGGSLQACTAHMAVYNLYNDEIGLTSANSTSLLQIRLRQGGIGSGNVN